MGEEAGWYRDPAPAHRDSPSTLRFWDGKSWTAQVKPASKRQRREWQEELTVQRIAEARMAAAAATSAGGLPGAGAPGGVLVADTSRDHTPDGQPLAGWGVRFGALLIDGLIVNVVAVVAGWRALHDMMSAVAVWAEQQAATSQAEVGAGAGPTGMLGPLLTFAAITFTVRILYGVGFLKAFQATPGKMFLGLEVRLRETPGPMSWGTVLARWGTQNAAIAIAVVPLVGLFYWVYPLLDGLWPLWDGRRQALHDKVARTNVVRTR
jgi:uncharacterized RDD family membrane protein YckC